MTTRCTRIVLIASAWLACAACSSSTNGSSSTASTVSGSVASSAGSQGSSTAGATSSTGSTASSTGGTSSSAASSAGSSGTAVASSSSSGGSTGGPSCPPPADAGPPVYLALIRGTLAWPDGGAPADGMYSVADLATLKAKHDAIAAGGQPISADAGDFAHDVLLGTTLLDSKLNEFVALDRWTDKTSMQGFYANPQILAAFGSLFSGAPTIEFFEAQPYWVNWGDMDSGDVFSPYYFHFALGTQSHADPAAAQAAHDGVACYGKVPSIGAGNVAHVVFTGLADPTRFLAVDIWKDNANIVAFYTNPQFVAAFSPLFTSVSQPVYASTDWYQW